MEREELLWRQFELDTKLYRDYLELVIKFNFFYYAITGGILSFYFANTEKPHIVYSLLLPIIMSGAFAAFFFYAANLATVTRKNIFALRDELKLKVAPDVGVLVLSLRIFGGIFSVAELTLIILFFCNL